jgi:hypothetical protein
VALRQSQLHDRAFTAAKAIIVPSFHCGGALGLPWWKLHVPHEFHEPGKLGPDTGHIQNTVGFDVHTIQGSVAFLIDMDRVTFKRLAHCYAIADGVDLDPA